MFPKLDRSSVRWLNREVSKVEIKAEVYQLGVHKAAGPDGVPAAFFQKYWHMVEGSICHFITEIFKIGVIPENLNQSIIFLLPKQ